MRYSEVILWALARRKPDDDTIKTGYFETDTDIAMMFLRMTVEHLEAEKKKIIKLMFEKL